MRSFIVFRTVKAFPLTVLLSCLAVAPSTQASTVKLRHVAPGMTPGVRGDGERYLATAIGSTGVRLFDVRTRKRRDITNPLGCFFNDIHRGVLLWTCNDTGLAYKDGATFDLRSGEGARLPAPTPLPGSSPDGSQFSEIGDRWARVQFSGYHYAYDAFVDRSTGRTVHPKQAPDRLEDLDRSPLVRRLCRGQRRTSIADTASGLGVEIGPLATAGRWAAGTTYEDVEDPVGRVELQRCETRPKVVRRCMRFACSQPVITSRWVAWTESVRGTTGRLVVRSLKTGRTRRSAPRRTGMIPLLMDGDLFVVAGDHLLRASV